MSMSITKATFAVVLAVALIAGAASAQGGSPNQEVEGSTAALEELVEKQERLIKQQQALIGEQEALLNAYRCMFFVDVEVVPGGCFSSTLSEAEAADGALMCAGWRAERQDTQRVMGAWVDIAAGLESGTIDMDFWGMERAAGWVDGYYARVSAVIPNLASERFTRLMGAMADDIKAVADTYARGGPADEMAAAIITAVDRLRELDAALAEVCNRPSGTA